jgi:hypothetical protein
MFPRAVGMRSFNSSDLAHEKAMITRLLYIHVLDMHLISLST